MGSCEIKAIKKSLHNLTFTLSTVCASHNYVYYIINCSTALYLVLWKKV